MHSVIQHILERKSKKVPINDGRKIVLVLYGGSMTCIRTLAVMQALTERGLAEVFDQVYTISGSFAIASHFLSGQLENTEHIFFEDMSAKKLVNFLRFWKMFDADYLVSLFRNKRPLNHQGLIETKTDLFLAANNLDKNEIEYLEIHDFSLDDYFKLLQISTSPDYFTPGAIKLNNSRYKDVPFRNHVHQAHFQKAIDSGASDILLIFNYARQHRRAVSEPLPPNAFCVVPKPEWNLSRFETQAEKLKEQYSLMKDYMEEILSGII